MPRSSSGLFRSASILASGSVAAHAPQLLLAPLISRTFEPIVFGSFGLFVAWHSIGAVIATLRLENAVAVPAELDEASQVVRLAVCCAAMISALCAAVFWTFTRAEPGTALALGAAVGAYAISQTLSYWHQRQFRFRRVAISRVLRGATMPVLWIALARQIDPYLALVLGFAMAHTLAIFPLLDRALVAAPLRTASLTATLHRFRRFPMLSLPADLVNALTSQAPLIILTSQFGAAPAGQFVFAQRYFAAPVSVVSGAIADSFKQHAAAEIREVGTPAQSWRRMRRMLGWLCLAGAAATIVAGRSAFVFLFGAEWATAGTFAAILAPLTFAALFVSPFSRVLYLRERQDLDLMWQLALGVIGTVALAIGAALGTPASSLFCFSIAYVLMYAVYWRILERVAECPSDQGVRTATL